jgi:Fe-S cluster assembly protein SufD
MSVVKAETAPYLQAFRARGEAQTRRAAAIDRFAELGLPTRRDEAWRFTDLRALQKQVYAPLAGPREATPDLGRLRLGVPSHFIAIVNGHFTPALSRIGDLPKGAYIGALSARPDLLDRALEIGNGEARQPFASLNAAFFADGFAVVLPYGVVLDRPVEIVHWAEPGEAASLHTRHLILAAPRSSATIVETFAGAGASWTNAVSLIEVAAAATLRHAKLQIEAIEAIHIALERVRIADEARYESFLLTLGAGLSRRDTMAAIDGEKAHCGVSGVYLLRGGQDSTQSVQIDHMAPCSETHEVWKGVVDERAHAAFQGKIGVRREAQKTDAHQLNKNLLLSPRASVDTKPELEIFADDVKCSHGATVGDLDEAALFYLRSRGLEESVARRMLIDAFAADALELVEDTAVRAYLQRHVQAWLGKEAA